MLPLLRASLSRLARPAAAVSSALSPIDFAGIELDDDGSI